jgi:hypothetical protein
MPINFGNVKYLDNAKCADYNSINQVLLYVKSLIFKYITQFKVYHLSNCKI